MKFSLIGDGMTLRLVQLAERMTDRGQFKSEQDAIKALVTLNVGEAINTGVSSWERVQ